MRHNTVWQPSSEYHSLVCAEKKQLPEVYPCQITGYHSTLSILSVFSRPTKNRTDTSHTLRRGDTQVETEAGTGGEADNETRGNVRVMSEAMNPNLEKTDKLYEGIIVYLLSNLR